jgi:hypothetical protein
MITEARETLAAELAAGIDVPVWTEWPDRFTAPCVLLVPAAGSYITSGGYGGQYVMALDIIAVTGRGSFDVVLPSLERLVEQVLTYSADWSLSGVDNPSLVQISGTEYLATTVHVSKAVGP